MREPIRAGDLVRGILREVGTKVGRAEVTRALEKVLGPERSDQCHVRAFRGGRLVVEVEPGPLFAELAGFRVEEVRTAMNMELETRKVSRIVFRMGGTGHV